MSKKNGFNPFIFLTEGDQPGDDVVVGQHSNQGNDPSTVFMMGFDEWCESPYWEDYDYLGDGPDMDEYLDWWEDIFGAETYEDYHGEPWPRTGGGD